MEEYSFSKLTTFEQCAQKYHDTYVGKKKGKENAFSQYGTMCHEILERCAKGEIEPFELADEYELGFATEITEEFPPNSYVDLSTSYYNDGLNFFSNFDGFDDLEILGVEKKFSIEIKHPDENYKLRGVVDLIYRNKKGELIVRDWKSKSKFANKIEKAKYARQLYVYAIYVKQLLGEYPKSMEFYMFRKNKIDPVKFNQDELNETIDWMNNVVTNIRQEKEYHPSYDDWFCSWLCDYRGMCQYARQIKLSEMR